jgi:NAD(P)-dependent dehydrogenase (short-subunit alcohol dehydrogenase family)
VLDMLRSLSGRSAVVVGGARGLGAAIAGGLREAGASVVVLDRVPPSAHVSPFIEVDIADRLQVVSAYKGVDALVGRVDIALHAAGLPGTDQPSESTPDKEWQELLDVNLSGTFWCCQEAGRRMLADGRGGSVVNFAGLAGVMVAKTCRTAPYHAASAAIAALTRDLAVEWGPRGVRVNCIATGDPDLTESQHDGDAHLIPLRRAADQADMVPLTLLLASDGASYITGQTIVVDGGRGIPMD